ncbi:MAG: FtsQ-type POTRA domain-containing protein [Aeromicrobium sp.]
MSEQRFAERRRSVLWRRVRRVLLALLGLGVVAGVVWVFWFSSALAVNRIVVDGTTTLKPMDIRSTAAVRLGEPLVRVDTVAIESRVAMMERIDQVDVSRHWPRTIKIEVVERKPIAWVTSGVAIRALDRYGVDFRTLRKEPKDLVEVQVETIDSRRRQQALESSAAVLEQLRTEDPGLLKKVQYVRVSSKDSVQLVLGKNRTVIWGSAAKGEQKLTVLRSLLKIKARGYDVSAPEQPTTRR